MYTQIKEMTVLETCRSVTLISRINIITTRRCLLQTEARLTALRMRSSMLMQSLSFPRPGQYLTSTRHFSTFSQALGAQLRLPSSPNSEQHQSRRTGLIDTSPRRFTSLARAETMCKRRQNGNRLKHRLIHPVS